MIPCEEFIEFVEFVGFVGPKSQSVVESGESKARSDEAVK